MTSPPATSSSRLRSGSPGKVFDGSAPCGPALVTPDEAGDPGGVNRARPRPNGERMQEATTADLIFGVAELVAHLSSLMTLEPGDVGLDRDPLRASAACAIRGSGWKPGDEVVVSSPHARHGSTTTLTGPGG